MPTIDVQGTQFTFSILPPALLSLGEYAKLQIAVHNEFISYQTIVKNVTREETENLITTLHRFLAGAYAREYNLSFEQAGFAVDLYPYMLGEEEVVRAVRRENDCVTAFRLLMRSKKRQFLGGVYTVLLHREELEKFAADLEVEFENAFRRYGHGRGKFHFVGVSPMGYKGCRYWYFDESGKVEKGDHVWVRMGKHNTEQVVYVDCVRDCTSDSIPVPEHRVKDVIKMATEEEVKSWQMKQGK